MNPSYLPAWLLMLAVLGLLLLTMASQHAARRSAARARAAAAGAQTCTQVALVLARAVLDHEQIEQLAAAVPRTGEVEALDRLLLCMSPTDLAEQLVGAYASTDAAASLVHAAAGAAASPVPGQASHPSA
jgi:hypothetical protein